MRYVRSLRALSLFVFVFLLAACQAWGADPTSADYPGVVGIYSRLVEGIATGLMPSGMYFVEREDPKAPKREHIIIEGGTDKDVWLMVEDSDGDGQIDPGDYYPISITVHETISTDVLVGKGELSSTDQAPPYLLLSDEDKAAVDRALDAEEADWARRLSSRFSYSGLFVERGEDTDMIEWTWTGKPYLTYFDPAGGIQPVVGRIRLHAMQQGGGDDADYKEQETSLSFTLAWGLEAVTEDIRYGWPTATVSITVRPRDTGGADGDNGGGSCALGLGGSALLLACLVAWRRRR